jgi:hypothetical protein
MPLYSRENKTRKIDGALIMDCNAALLKTTEAMADLSKTVGLNASRRLLYQSPTQDALKQWKQIYGFRSASDLRN